MLFSEQVVLEEGGQLKNEHDDSDDEEDEVEGKSEDYFILNFSLIHMLGTYFRLYFYVFIFLRFLLDNRDAQAIQFVLISPGESR